jgi:hypothetical protein
MWPWPPFSSPFIEAVATVTARELSDTMKPWLKHQKRIILS